jgi:polyhydroxyalkanoate synthase subunit PhaC
MASEIRAAATLADHIGEQAAEHTLAANPLVGVRGQDILDSAGTLLGRVVTHPAVAARQYVSFLSELGRILTGG